MRDRQRGKNDEVKRILVAQAPTDAPSTASARAPETVGWLFVLVASVIVFSCSCVAAAAAPGYGTTGYKLVATYGPICTKPHHCGMQPIVHATSELLLHDKVVARKVTDVTGSAVLIPTVSAMSGYSILVTGRADGRKFLKRDRLPAMIKGLLMPYYLTVCVTSFC